MKPYYRTFLVLILLSCLISQSVGQDLISCSSFENCEEVTAVVRELQTRMNTLEADNAALRADNDALKLLLADVSRGIDPNTGQDTLTFSDMNIQIVNGSGSTAGTPNGTGNLIIGYNEFRNEGENVRTGSHMLAIGVMNNYSSYGGMVVGNQNTVSGELASVSGGTQNVASGTWSSISGGSANAASEIYASISGGANNTASGSWAYISGGSGHTASGLFSTVSGGTNNIASGTYATVSGGNTGKAETQYCNVGDNGVDC